MVVILPLEPRSFTVHRFGITITNEAYSVIIDVEITVSPFNFQVTDGNSQLLNRVPMVTESNKTKILPFIFVYWTLNE